MSEAELVKPQRLLEELPGFPEEPKAAGVSTWHEPEDRRRCQDLVEGISRRSSRPPFSHAAQKTAEELQEALVGQGFDARLLALASRAPRRSLALVFALGCVACLLLAHLHVAIALLLSLLWVAGIWLEWGGVYRFSQHFFAPRQTYGLDVPILERSEAGEQEQGLRVILWAALDLPPSDLIYHPGAFSRYLRPLRQHRVMPALVVALLFSLTPVWLFGWWLFPKGVGRPLAMAWALLLLGLGVGLAWLRKEREDAGSSAAAVAVAVEAARRLQKLQGEAPLPSEIRLFLAGASQFDGGLEAWKLQEFARGRDSALARDLVLCVGPLGAHGQGLCFATHTGLLFPMSYPDAMAELLDWTSARVKALASPSSSWHPEPFPGVLPSMGCEVQQGLILGQQEPEGEADSPPKAVEIDYQQLDVSAGFLVAFVQALAQDWDAEE